MLYGQINIQVGLGLRKAIINQTSNGLGKIKFSSHPVVFVPNIGLNKTVTPKLGVGLEVSHQRHKKAPYVYNSFSSQFIINGIDFSQTKIGSRFFWIPTKNLYLSSGLTVSYFSSFKYRFAGSDEIDTPIYFRSQLGIMGRVGYRINRFSIQLEYDKGLAYSAQYFRFFKPISALEVSIIYEQPVNKRKK
ncbi:MAG: hypothetical protein WBA17_00080 [Saprospiraceae bacterium]